MDATIGEAKKPKKLAGNAANEADEIESSADRSAVSFQKNRRKHSFEERFLFAGRPLPLFMDSAKRTVPDSIC